jgi:hypothetical protein
MVISILHASSDLFEPTADAQQSCFEDYIQPVRLKFYGVADMFIPRLETLLGRISPSPFYHSLLAFSLCYRSSPAIIPYLGSSFQYLYS